mmetsp:Transcript_94230/g.196678  ORF Transcript_94230/g.196678 Transcript_94230/m.196678 type:complete len:249 (-) Transcript_94230:635-1381(-)
MGQPPSTLQSTGHPFEQGQQLSSGATSSKWCNKGAVPMGWSRNCCERQVDGSVRIPQYQQRNPSLTRQTLRMPSKRLSRLPHARPTSPFQEHHLTTRTPSQFRKDKRVDTRNKKKKKTSSSSSSNSLLSTFLKISPKTPLSPPTRCRGRDSQGVPPSLQSQRLLLGPRFVRLPRHLLHQASDAACRRRSLLRDTCPPRRLQRHSMQMSLYQTTKKFMPQTRRRANPLKAPRSSHDGQRRPSAESQHHP